MSILTIKQAMHTEMDSLNRAREDLIISRKILSSDSELIDDFKMAIAQKDENLLALARALAELNKV